MVHLRRNISTTPAVNSPSGISIDTPHGVDTLRGVVRLTVDGRGNFQNSPELKVIACAQLAHGVSRIVVDLQRCTSMDSTFMGMLSCVAARLEDGGGELHVVNAEGKNGELLRGLGLDEVFTVKDDGGILDRMTQQTDVAVQPVLKVDRSREDQRRICLEAHEALAEVTEKNAEQFREVIQLMRDESEPAPVAH